MFDCQRVYAISQTIATAPLLAHQQIIPTLSSIWSWLVAFSVAM
jgi:hypothetical protein